MTARTFKICVNVLAGILFWGGLAVLVWQLGWIVGLAFIAVLAGALLNIAARSI